MSGRARGRVATQTAPRVRAWKLTGTAVPDSARSARQDMTVPRKRDGPIVQPYRKRLHRIQVSFGKLTLLSADCFGSGAMVGSSRMVADSSGTCGAPGAGGFGAEGFLAGGLAAVGGTGVDV